MLNRRSFLARLGFGTVAAAAAATGVIDIERLLWVPGEKTIFLPTVVWPEDCTADWITRETLRILKNNLSFTACFNRDYEAAFVGSTVRVGLPRRFA